MFSNRVLNLLVERKEVDWSYAAKEVGVMFHCSIRPFATLLGARGAVLYRYIHLTWRMVRVCCHYQFVGFWCKLCDMLIKIATFSLNNTTHNKQEGIGEQQWYQANGTRGEEEPSSKKGGEK